MKKNLVSIVVNCFNGEKYLQKCLDSLLRQKYQNYEVIFVDNCSKDKSAKIFKNIKDKRFKYFKTPKKIKLYDARNFALKKCKGNFISFLDVDDWWDDKFLFSRKKFFNSSSIYGFSYSNCYHYYENTKKYKKFYNQNYPSGYITKDLLKYYFVKNGTFIIKKKVFNNYKFNSYYNIIGDYDFILRISEKFKAMAFNDILVNVRIHQSNFTHNNRKIFFKEYKKWLNEQDFNKIIYNENRDHLINKLEYLRLIHLLQKKKNIGLFKDILFYPSIFFKLKLLLVYFTPIFMINFKNRYF